MKASQVLSARLSHSPNHPKPTPLNNEVMKKIRHKRGMVVISFIATCLFPANVYSQQPGSSINAVEQEKQVAGNVMIPRVTKPWSEALRWVGDEKTLHSDFAIIKDKRNQWHCIGTFGIEPDGVGDGRAASDAHSMFHAVGPSLEKPLKSQPKIRPGIESPQPATMWAPGATWNKEGTTAYMYYYHNYGWEIENGAIKAYILPEKSGCRLLTSSEPDLYIWKPYDGGKLPDRNLVFNEPSNRDFCVFWDERVGKYLMYYATNDSPGPKIRTSDDLIHWSEPKTVLTVLSGDPHGYSESPFVLFRDGLYYLWTSGIDYSHTHLYISEDPFNFGDAIENSIEEIPGHAPEIVTDNGMDYMACSMISTYPSKSPGDHDLNGIYIQKLRWEKAAPEMEKRITRKK